MSEKITAVFDIGKTNKKMILFDHELNVVHVEQQTFKEIKDDDGFFSEDIKALTAWIDEGVRYVTEHASYDLQQVNFTTYGASLVHLDREGNLATPFYNYLKPIDKNFLDGFFDLYGNRDTFSMETASPIMGLLNSGYQLYFLKHRKKQLFEKIHCSLHLPQYLSYLYTKQLCTEYTSIGCHTIMWDFTRQSYHEWLKKEDLTKLLPDPTRSPAHCDVNINGKPVRVGVGVHDSSSALLPYQTMWDDPFVLISTGTWSICMNPFNKEPLTRELLKQDCLNFLSPSGSIVRASRLFLGKEFSNQVEKLCAYFMCDEPAVHKIQYQEALVPRRGKTTQLSFRYEYINPGQLGFKNGTVTDYSKYESMEEAYYHLMDELTDIQLASLQLAIGSGKVAHIFVDGGFSDNEVFLGMLAGKLPGHEVYAATVAQGSALGAALLVSGSSQSKEHLRKHAEFKWIRPKVHE